MNDAIVSIREVLLAAYAFVVTLWAVGSVYSIAMVSVLSAIVVYAYMLSAYRLYQDEKAFRQWTRNEQS